jgi:hypothetical protein
VFADPAGGSCADFCAGLRAPFARDFRYFGFRIGGVIEKNGCLSLAALPEYLSNYVPRSRATVPVASGANSGAPLCSLGERQGRILWSSDDWDIEQGMESVGFIDR